MFMTAVVVTYIFAEPDLALGRLIPYHIAIIIGIGITVLISGFYLFKLFIKKDRKVEQN